TNHVVHSNNADQVVGNQYTWIINKENAQNKSIQIEISNVVKEKHQYWLIILVFSGILVIILIIYLVINRKNRIENQI
ncbi:MAG: hypothetical protein PUB18_04820, partial [bacterium]|nr:hypothetical protein [bacterium]